MQNFSITTNAERKQKANEKKKLCNCKNITNWLIEGKCFTKSVVYKATVTHQDKNM